MRILPTALTAYLPSRKGFKSRVLVWIVARDRVTGLPQEMGLWNGAGARVFTINGVDRTYQGAGAVINVPSIAFTSDMTVQMQSVMLSGISAAVKEAIVGYDARFAPFEVHRAVFDNDGGALVCEPQRLLKGIFDEVTFNRPAPGSSSTATVSVAPWLRRLTLFLAGKRSDATQQLNAGDRFRRYIDVTGTVSVWWGQNRS